MYENNFNDTIITRSLTKRPAYVLSLLFVFQLIILLPFIYFPVHYVVIGYGGLILLCLIFFYPFIGFLLCVFLMYTNFFVGISISRGLLPVVLITGVSWLSNKFLRVDFDIRVEKSQITGILLFLFFAVISIFSSTDMIQSFRVLLQFLKLLIFYLLFINIVNDEKKLKFTVYSFLAFMVLSVLYSFYQLYGGGAISMVVNRMRGLGGDPNLFAARVIFILPFPFLMIFHAKKLLWKIMYAGLLGILVAGIALSLSRGGAVSLIVVLLTLFIIKRKTKLIWVLSFLLVVLLIFFLPEEFWERINSLSNINLGMSLRNRLRLAKSALFLFINNPLTGVGLGNFIVLSNKFIYIHQYAHSTFLEVAAETGLFGITAFTGLIIVGFKNIISAKKNFDSAGKSFYSTIAESILVGYAGFLVSSAFLSLETDFVLWTIISLGSALYLLSLDTGKIYE